MAEILRLRHEYHDKIRCNILGHRAGSIVYSNADSSNRLSIALAKGIADRIGEPFCTNPPSGQAAGTMFTRFTREFIEEAFLQLQHVRPGSWTFSVSQAGAGITAYDQYRHLADLDALAHTYPEVRTALGGDYLITPDIVIGREPLSDHEINAHATLVGADLAALTALRRQGSIPPSPTLHASVSCKWTMRSDRAQNTRTEALNLMRNRKGKTPHVIVVTAEPTPRRIASIAMGTGDIDCTYHFALPELLATLENGVEALYEDPLEELRLLIAGRRLRDISDLPFDLAI